MLNDYIVRKSNEARKLSPRGDPFEAAERFGVHIIYNDGFSKLRGMYKVIKRSRFIIINSNKSAAEQAVVCAHELGHDRLHRDAAAKDAFCEYDLYNLSCSSEYEANLFAANFLVDSDKLLSLAKRGYTASQIASALRTDVNLIALKARLLSFSGCDLHLTDYVSDFLKNKY